MLIVTISYLNCQISQNDWEIDDLLVSEENLAAKDDDFYDRFKDKGCMKNDEEKPKDYVFVQSFKKIKYLNIQLMKMRLN